MALRRSICALACASSVLGAGCFGELGAESTTETDGSTGVATTSTSSSESGVAETSVADASSTGSPVVCKHLDILVITDVSLWMAPFAGGIINVLLALGTRIEETFEGVASYNLALAYNVAPVVNEQAFELPPEGEGCTQLGALVRGIDGCVEAYDGRPYLNEDDDLGAGLTCIAGGLIGGQYDPSHETPRMLDSLVALLEGEEDPALSACNADFHRSPDPLLIIMIVDDDDESETAVLQAVTSAVATQGTSLDKIGVFLIGADASDCPDEGENACGARPACNVQEFLDIGFNNVGLGGNLRRFNICRTLEPDSAAVADDLIGQISAVYPTLCE